MSEALKKLRKGQDKKQYKLKRPEVTKEELENLKRKGRTVRFEETSILGDVYSIDGYFVILKRR